MRMLLRILIMFLTVGSTLYSLGQGKEDPVTFTGAPSDYFPLKVGMRWTYAVNFNGSQGKTMQVWVTDVEQSEPGTSTFVVSIADNSVSPKHTIDEPMIYTIESGKGIYLPKTNDYLLKEPLRVNRTWQGGESGRNAIYRVLSVNNKVKLGRRIFKHCLVVERRDSQRRVETTYAPGIGPVRIRFYNQSGPRSLIREEILLRLEKNISTPE